MIKQLKTPISELDIASLKAGDLVEISGYIYTGRDAAHERMANSVIRNETLPFDFNGQVIYYVGPTPAKPNRPIGSCGPTSSYRMDKYAKPLMKAGLKVMIGKGDRSDEFINDMITEKSVYMQAVGGAGALLSRRVISSEVIEYHDLGTEAIRRLEVSRFPVVVCYDIYGGNIVKNEIEKYRTIEVSEE
jgi:fumarate hydratase subunit beta